MARHKKTATDPGAWLSFDDEAGQGRRPPEGRTWGRPGHTPIVRVTAAGTNRISIVAMICTRSGHRSRLIYRIHLDRGPAKGRRKGFTETDCARLLDAAHQQLGGPIVLVRDNLNTHVSRTMWRLVDTRLWLTGYQLPPFAPEFSPVEVVRSHLKRSLAKLTEHSLDQRTALVKTRLERMQYRPSLTDGLIAKTGLDFRPP